MVVYETAIPTETGTFRPCSPMCKYKKTVAKGKNKRRNLKNWASVIVIRQPINLPKS